MKKNILLVDDEMPILLTLKAVLEISGFDVDIATSAREGKYKLHHGEYHMVITDMRMENELAGVEVIEVARNAPYAPAVALLTAFPVADEDWQDMGADQMLVKPMQTRMLLDQIELLLAAREERLAADAVAAVAAALTEVVEEAAAASRPAKPKPAKLGSAKKPPASAGKPILRKVAAKKKTVAKKAPAKKAKKKATKKTTAKRAKKAVKKSAKKTSTKRPRAAKKVARRRR